MLLHMLVWCASVVVLGLLCKIALPVVMVATIVTAMMVFVMRIDEVLVAMNVDKRYILLGFIMGVVACLLAVNVVLNYRLGNHGRGWICFYILAFPIAVAVVEFCGAFFDNFLHGSEGIST